MLSETFLRFGLGTCGSPFVNEAGAALAAASSALFHDPNRRLNVDSENGQSYFLTSRAIGLLPDSFTVIVHKHTKAFNIST
jgi:hypothetical protein